LKTLILVFLAAESKFNNLSLPKYNIYQNLLCIQKPGGELPKDLTTKKKAIST
jgi:hypothetical protein